MVEPEGELGGAPHGGDYRLEQEDQLPFSVISPDV